MPENLSKKEKNLMLFEEFFEENAGIEPEDVIFSPIGNTELVSKVFLNSTRDLTVTIRPNSIQFSTSSVNFFSHTNYIELNIDKENKWLIVTANDRDSIDSQRWCTVKNGKRESKKLTGKDLPTRIYSLMNWNKGFYYKAFGYLAAATDEDYEPFLAYKLMAFRGTALSASARKAARVSDDDVGLEVLAQIRDFDRQQQKERKAAEERGEKFVTKRLVITGGVPEDSFGIMRKDKETQNQVPKEFLDLIRRKRT